MQQRNAARKTQKEYTAVNKHDLNQTLHFHYFSHSHKWAVIIEILLSWKHKLLWPTMCSVISSQMPYVLHNTVQLINNVLLFPLPNFIDIVNWLLHPYIRHAVSPGIRTQNPAKAVWWYSSRRHTANIHSTGEKIALFYSKGVEALSHSLIVEWGEERRWGK